MSWELSEIQTDVLKEMINIGMGRAAHILSEMVHSQVSLQVPSVRVVSHAQACQDLGQISQEHLTAVILGYQGFLTGNALLCFPAASAAKLTSFLIGESAENTDMDALKMATLTEVGNIMLNGVVGSISNLLEEYLQFTVPFYEEGRASDLLQSHLSSRAEVVVIAETSLEVKALHIVGETFLLLAADSFEVILKAIGKMVERYMEV